MSSVVILVGPGAINTALAVELLRLGFAPRFIGRKGPCAFKASYLAGEVIAEVDLPGPSQKELTGARAAFVAVKAFDLGQALADLVTYLPAGTPIIPVGNGAVESIVAKAAQQSPQFKWRLGYCTFGVSQISAGHYALRSSKGRLAFGAFLPANDVPTADEKIIIKGSHFCEWHANIIPLLRRKWLFNTTINSLCAARRLRQNGELLQDAVTLSAVFNEAFNLGSSLWGAWPQERKDMYALMVKLIQDTALNENSMARDLRLGQRTESDFLAGLAAEKSGFPLLQQLHQTITAAQKP